MLQGGYCILWCYFFVWWFLFWVICLRMFWLVIWCVRFGLFGCSVVDKFWSVLLLIYCCFIRIVVAFNSVASYHFLLYFDWFVKFC